MQSLAQKVQKPHLRNLFFRVSTLYRLGASLVFVIDGEATQLKWGTLDKREGRGEERRRRTGRRTILQSYVNEVMSYVHEVMSYVNEVMSYVNEVMSYVNEVYTVYMCTVRLIYSRAVHQWDRRKWP